MNEFEYCFDPDLKPVFSKAAYRDAQRYRQNGRALFHALMQDGEEPALYPFAYHFIEQRLSRLASPAQTALPKTWDNKEIACALRSVDSLPATALSGRLDDALTQLQPVLLTEPCWLRNVLQTADNQAPAAIVLSSVYSSLSSMNAPNKAFQALLLHAGLEIPDLNGTAFAEHKGIDEPFFDLAALQSALALFPRAYFPEILGFTFAYCHSRSLLEGFAGPAHPELSHYLEHRRSLLSASAKTVTAAIRDYLSRFENRRTEELWPRIAAGLGLYRQSFQQCERQLRRRSENPPTALEAAANTLAGKAAAACGHHGRISLEGRPLDGWFAEIPFDSRRFLAALRRSPYVDRQNPAASPLLGLFEFEGPMFGVMSGDDIQCLQRWLTEEQAEEEDRQPPLPLPPADWLPGEGEGNLSPVPDKPSRRELYYYLVNAELYPDILPAARRTAEQVLRSAHRFSRLPFEKYSHGAFDDYIDTLYRQEMKAYEPLAGKPKLSREAYVWGIEQLAPAILTDGCWLQQASRLRFTSHAAIGATLYKIYDDEIGNGIEARSHPVIYRRLLESLHIELPPIHRRAFCRHPGFIDAAFDIPVYLMAISQFPAAFLPELLGLNMAIELSGLGRAYLRLAEELEFWGIDPAIVNVHITIDNLASGHAALAKDAIQRYLDQIAASQGNLAKEAHWRRVYDGFRSLAAVSRTFKIALVVFYLCKRFKSRYTGRHVITCRSDQNA